MRRGRVSIVGTVWALGFTACGGAQDFQIDALSPPAVYEALRFEDAARHCGFYDVPEPSPVGSCVAQNAVVRNYDNTLFTGTVDVTACVARITAGQKLPYPHDGTVFRNAQHRLPQAPAGFYHEYVDPTPGLSGPGPQRLVWGGYRVWYYTPDHYDTFIPVTCSNNVEN